VEAGLFSPEQLLFWSFCCGVALGHKATPQLLVAASVAFAGQAEKNYVSSVCSTSRYNGSCACDQQNGCFLSSFIRALKAVLADIGLRLAEYYRRMTYKLAKYFRGLVVKIWVICFARLRGK
jgi:hypothetical protein